MLHSFSMPFVAISPTMIAMIEMIPITVGVIFYWHRAMHLSWDDRSVPLWRQLCFGSGMFLIAFMLYSPWGYLAEELIIFHMIEHLMIGDVASLLVVLGLTRSILQPILSIPFFFKLQFLTHPFVAFPLWAINLFVWHIPAIYDIAYGPGLFHGVQHAAFFFFGTLMWMPVFGPLPKPIWFGAGWRIIYVAVVRFGAGILGNVLMWTQFEFYKRYAEGHIKWGISAVADQSIAGVVMMMEGLIFILGVLTWTYFQAAKASARKQDLLDLAYLHGVKIDEDRIERAVQSGHDELLERRIRTADSAVGLTELDQAAAAAGPAAGEAGPVDGLPREGEHEPAG